MQTDMLPYKCRPLAEIKRAWDEGYWIPREEEAIMLKSKAKPPAVNQSREKLQTRRSRRSEYTALSSRRK